MIIRDNQIRYGAVFEPAPRLPAFRRETSCDVCELWTVRLLQKGRVICVNFGVSYQRLKRAVICVNFGVSSLSRRLTHA